MSDGASPPHAPDAGWAWEALGIAPTGDVPAIRKAYAALLKAIDVDSDADGFVRLHAAFKRALGAAEGGAEGRAEGRAEPPAPGRGGAGPAGPAPDGAPRPAPAPDWTPDAGAAALQRLWTLLDEAAGEPDAEALRATTAEILGQPEMHNVDHAGRMESVLAEIAWRAIPRSDPIAPLLVRFFHWESRRGRIDQPLAFDTLIARARGQDLLGLTADPDHPLHQAYLSLLGWGEDPDRALHREIGSDVGHLLRVIRERAPAAMDSLHPARVAQWDARLGTTPMPDWSRVERVPVARKPGEARGGDPGRWLFGFFILALILNVGHCVAIPQ
jgi:hypothetical protein